MQNVQVLTGQFQCLFYLQYLFYLNQKLTKAYDSSGLTIEQITAQAFVFLIAGYTTDTSLLSFCLYELARHKSIQEELYENINNAVKENGGQLSYQALQDMGYMDQVINGRSFRN